MGTCPSCEHSNPAEAQFCNRCGTALALGCPSCDASNPPGARFCNRCGAPLGPSGGERSPRDYTPKHLAEKILHSKSALEGERKQLTVLFADVKGSMALAESVDSEKWHGILDGFFAVLSDGIHRFEGTINQYMGDGIMALFGAPIAHEDHAQRACYAALQLRKDLDRYAREVKREHGLAFSVRMGIHSGDVVVGKIGDDLRMDYTAQGHTVGLAARMQELASPDTVYLTGATEALVTGYFECDDLGPFSVKGVREPVAVFQLTGIGSVRTRFDASRARGLSRFVGRDRDMQTLDIALSRAREGVGQVVGVVADAGVGKSRLCFEFLERCRAEGLRVLSGGGVAHGKNIPLLPILQVFRDYYEITEQDSDQKIREKIAGRMLLFDEEYREVLPVLFEFFGAPDPENPAPRMDPEARQRQLFGVLRRVTQRDATQGVVVILIEDLHWIDPASEAWLQEWVDAVGGNTRRLLITNFRPEYHADWMQKSWYHQLPIQPLGPEAIRELLDDLLGSDPSLEGLAESIHARTAGNPFFTEEVVQSLVESGHLEGTRGRYRLVTAVEKLEVPTSVQPLLAARIDRLPEREKQVLQTAAVIGKEFPAPILEAVAELPRGELDETLRTLKAAEFIYEESLFPVAEYAFKHPLTQQVALDSQLRERRRRVHKAVASTIEAVYTEKLDEQSALLAHHWEQAGQDLVAARWHRRAAEWAGTNDIPAAFRHWHRVRELIQAFPDDAEAAVLGAEACRQILALGFRLGLSEEDAESAFAEGKRWAQKSGEIIADAHLELAYSIARVTAGHVADSIPHAEEGEGLFLRSDEAELRALAPWTRVYPLFVAGRLAEAEELLDRMIEETRGHPTWGFELWELSAWAWAHFMKGPVLSRAGDLEEARKWLERGSEIAREVGDSESEGWSHGWLAEQSVWQGDHDRALAAGQRSVELAENLGSPYSRAIAYGNLGLAMLAHQRWPEAAETLEHALGIARKSRTCLECEGRILARWAEAMRGAGDLSRARTLAHEAVEVAARDLTPIDAIEAQLALARVLLAQDGAAAADAIRAALAAAERHVDETGARNLRPPILVERAELARLEGDAAAWEAGLREAGRLQLEHGAPAQAERIAAQLPGS